MAKKQNKFSFEFDPAPESTSHIQLNEQYDLYINGKWQKPSSKKYFDSINPANETVLSKVALADSKDVDKAVKAAE